MAWIHTSNHFYNILTPSTTLYRTSQVKLIPKQKGKTIIIFGKGLLNQLLDAIKRGLNGVRRQQFLEATKAFDWDVIRCFVYSIFHQVSVSVNRVQNMKV